MGIMSSVIIPGELEFGVCSGFKKQGEFVMLAVAKL